MGLGFVAAGFWVGCGPLHDNSFLTHLATGRLILHGDFPHHDPFSFTAHGAPWVVQSWLPALGYATAERIGGATAIRAMAGLLAGALMALVWRATRPAATLLPRIAIAALVFVIGTGLWSTRPFMVGLVCLAFTIVVVQERRHPIWLVPAYWIWVNSHGSWPLGLVLLAVWAIGDRLAGAQARPALRALRYAATGTMAGAVGPLGTQALAFPVELLARSSVLSNVVEWQAPTFRDLSQRTFVAAVVVAVVALARRPRYREALLLAVFVAAALVGMRNVVVAAVVLVPVLATGLAGLGTIGRGSRSRTLTVAAGAFAAVALLGSAAKLQGPSWALDAYPVEATAYLRAHGLLDRSHRVVAREVVGNYWEARFGTAVHVFFDDRFDMYPAPVIAAANELGRAAPGWRSVLARFHPDAVLWERSAPLSQVLDAAAGWQRVYSDSRWAVFVPASR